MVILEHPWSWDEEVAKTVVLAFSELRFYEEKQQADKWQKILTQHGWSDDCSKLENHGHIQGTWF